MNDIRELVRQKYAAAITAKKGCGCGGGTCCGDTATNVVTGNLYRPEETAGLPPDALAASLGCGNPTALGDLYAGEIVLDLGSGAGLDVLLSARRVGARGKAYGLDMTDEMLAAANANKAQSNIGNAEFLKGHIENIPLPDNSVDVVISNCVINLSADKDQVFREINRVLRPGGRMAVSDIVTTRPLPENVRQSLLAWAGCIGGALGDEEYRNKLDQAGFENIEIVVTRVYDTTIPEAANLLPGLTAAELANINGSLVSAFIRAKKPTHLLVPDNDYAIRPARQEDVTAIEKLLVASDLPTAGIVAGLEHFLVADRAGIIGVIGSEYADTAVLFRSLAVEQSLRKAGVAAALVEAALVKARVAGAKSSYLLTQTAAKFFAKRGFRPVDRAEVPAQFLDSQAVTACCSSACAAMRLDL